MRSERTPNSRRRRRGGPALAGALAALIALGAGAESLYLDRLDAPGPQPEGLASDGEHLWVGDFQTGLIYRVDTDRPESTTAFASPGHRVEGLAWDGTHLWSADYETKLIYRLEVTDTALVVTRTLTPPGTGKPVGLAWDGEALWLTTWTPFYLYRVDPVTGQALVTRMIQAPAEPLYPTAGVGRYPEDLAWDGEALWITDWYTGKVYRIDPQTLTHLETREAGGDRSLGLAFHQGYLWNGDTAAPTSLYRLDITTSTPVRRVSWGTLKRWAEAGSKR